MKKIRLAVLMGGKSPEYEISLLSGREVVKYLNPQKYEVLPIVISRDGRRWQIVVKEKLLHSPAGEEVGKSSKFNPPTGGQNSKSLTAQNQNLLVDKRVGKIDLVFIAMHGPYGEDGTLQGMLDFMGIPYCGSGMLASALGMDKIMFRKIMEREKIASPKYLVFYKGQPVSDIWKIFGRPSIFVKPYNQGSSVGASIVHQKKELTRALKLAFTYSNPVLIEEYLDGQEVSCGVLGNQNPQALPVALIVPKNEFFNYEAKYTPGKSEEIVPARISRVLTKKIQKIAVKVFQAIGCRGFGRVDMIIHKGKPVVLEINTIPGLTPVSILPKEARVAGFSYSQLLDKIVELALK